MMTDYNKFQQKVLMRLRPVMAKFGLKDEFREDGVKEKYLVLKSAESSVCIWIYTNEVAYRVDDNHVQCERQDFDSDNEMISFFLSSLEDQLTVCKRR